MKRTMAERIADERGSIINALVFIVIGIGLMATMLAFFMVRSTNDYVTGQQAKVKTAISQLSTNVIAGLNDEFPVAWQTMTPEQLAAATAPLGDSDQLQANAYLEHFSVNASTGVITANAVGESTLPGHVKVFASLKFVPSGAGVFAGLDGNGRPSWVYSDSNLDALALWQLSPNATQFISDTGDYRPDAPGEAPVLALTPQAPGAHVTISSVYCPYSGSAEYQTRIKNGSGAYSAWSEWGNGAPFDLTLGEGDHVEVQARARCVSSLSSGTPSDISNTVAYTVPITKVLPGPQVAISTSGAVSWGSVTCPADTAPQYRYQSRVNQGAWNGWTSWGSATSFQMNQSAGSLLEANVQARCNSSFVSGPASATGYASTVIPMTAAPAAPSVTLSGAITVAVTPSTCPAGSTAQYETRRQTNGGAWGAWSGWTSLQSSSIAAQEGSQTAVQAIQRCVTSYAQSPASAASKTVTKNLAVTSTPNQPTVTLSGSDAFTWANAQCPAGTAPLYKWRYQVNGGSIVGPSSNWAAKPSKVQVPVTQGSTLNVWLTALCNSPYSGNGPASAERKWNLVLPITTAPKAPAVSIGSDSSSWWSASGCPAGTSLQYQYRFSINEGNWGGFSSWGTTTSYGPATNQGGRAAVGVQDRCVNGATGAVGPNNYGESGVLTRGVDYPAVPANVARFTSGRASIIWSDASCPAGTRPEYTTNYFRTSPATNVWRNYNNGNWPVYDDGTLAPSGTTMYYDVYSRCDGAYANSAWMVRRAQWNGNNASGYPSWVSGGWLY